MNHMRRSVTGGSPKWFLSGWFKGHTHFKGYPHISFMLVPMSHVIYHQLLTAPATWRLKPANHGTAPGWLQSDRNTHDVVIWFKRFFGSFFWSCLISGRKHIFQNYRCFGYILGGHLRLCARVVQHNSTSWSLDALKWKGKQREGKQSEAKLDPQPGPILKASQGFFVNKTQK